MTLTDIHLPVQTINSNHPGADFGVVVYEESDAQMSLSECRTLLEEDGWSNAQEIPCARPGVRKFLVSRKK